MTWVVPELIRYGRVQRPTLGVELAPETWGQRLGIEGAVIYRVDRGTGAEKAGLQGSAAPPSAASSWGTSSSTSTASP